LKSQIHRRHPARLAVALLALTVSLAILQSPAQAQPNVIEVTNSNFGYTLRGTNGPGLPGFYCNAPLTPSVLAVSVNRYSTAIGSRSKTCTSSRTGKKIQGQLYILLDFQGDGVLNIRYHSVVYELSADGSSAWLCGERWLSSNISGRNRNTLTTGFTSSIRVPSLGEPSARGCATSEGDNYFAIEFSEGMRPR